MGVAYRRTVALKIAGGYIMPAMSATHLWNYSRFFLQFTITFKTVKFRIFC